MKFKDLLDVLDNDEKLVITVANECDQLATKYNALLEVCNAQYIQPK